MKQMILKYDFKEASKNIGIILHKEVENLLKEHTNLKSDLDYISKIMIVLGSVIMNACPNYADFKCKNYLLDESKIIWKTKWIRCFDPFHFKDKCEYRRRSSCSSFKDPKPKGRFEYYKEIPLGCHSCQKIKSEECKKINKSWIEFSKNIMDLIKWKNNLSDKLIINFTEMKIY
jgi:hypothetical protein